MQNLLVENLFSMHNFTGIRYFLFRKQASLLKVGVDGSYVYERHFKKSSPSKMAIKCHNNSGQFVLQQCKAEARTHASSNFTNL